MPAERASSQSFVTVGAEADLARRVSQGDASAHAELYRCFGAPLHRFAAARLNGDQDLAEEIVVETMAAAVRDIRRFRPQKAKLSAWLHGIARHRIQKELRNQQRGRSVPGSAQVSLETVGDLPSGDDMAASVTERLGTHQMVARLSTFLSDAEKEVLILRCLGEFSIREIARVIRRSERAAETLLHRAKQKARRELGDHAE